MPQRTHIIDFAREKALLEEAASKSRRSERKIEEDADAIEQMLDRPSRRSDDGLSSENVPSNGVPTSQGKNPFGSPFDQPEPASASHAAAAPSGVELTEEEQRRIHEEARRRLAERLSGQARGKGMPFSLRRGVRAAANADEDAGGDEPAASASSSRPAAEERAAVEPVPFSDIAASAPVDKAPSPSSDADSARFGGGVEPPRAAVATFSDEEGEGSASDSHDDAEEESAEGARSGLAKAVEERRRRVQKKRHDRRKARADRQFDRTVDASSDHEAAPDEDAPHAAVYEGRMGRSQRKSERMQGDRWARRRDARFDRIDKAMSGHTPRAWGAWLVVACVVFAAVMVYQPTKQYYLSMRAEQQAQAAYDVEAAHSQALQDEADDLTTDEGKEAKARQQYGMVKNDENAVRVQGADQGDATESSTASNASESIAKQDEATAPDTWYSGVLDALFGYQG